MKVPLESREASIAPSEPELRVCLPDLAPPEPELRVCLPEVAAPVEQVDPPIEASPVVAAPSESLRATESMESTASKPAGGGSSLLNRLKEQRAESEARLAAVLGDVPVSKEAINHTRY